MTLGKKKKNLITHALRLVSSIIRFISQLCFSKKKKKKIYFSTLEVHFYSNLKYYKNNSEKIQKEAHLK